MQYTIMKQLFVAFIFPFLLSGTDSKSQDLSAKEIVEKAYYNERSEAYTLDMTIEVIRPKWSRALTTRTWAKGFNYGMMVITAPAKDEGVSFMRLGSEGWNFLPSIDRIVKISPSQMAQSWMGSDYTNEDLLKEASILHDYTHQLVDEENVDGVICYKIEATPKPGAAVIWGKKIVWIGKEDLLERKTENYDELGDLISTLTKTDIREIGSKTIATTLTMTPGNKEGYRTVVTILGGDFKQEIDDYFFSKENMRQLN